MAKTADKAISLQAVTTRTASMADATIRAELAHARFLEALSYAQEDGASPREIAQAVDRAGLQRPDRLAVLSRLRATTELVAED